MVKRKEQWKSVKIPIETYRKIDALRGKHFFYQMINRLVTDYLLLKEIRKSIKDVKGRKSMIETINLMKDHYIQTASLTPTTIKKEEKPQPQQKPKTLTHKKGSYYCKLKDKYYMDIIDLPCIKNIDLNCLYKKCREQINKIIGVKW